MKNTLKKGVMLTALLSLSATASADDGCIKVAKNGGSLCFPSNAQCVSNGSEFGLSGSLSDYAVCVIESEAGDDFYLFNYRSYESIGKERYYTDAEVIREIDPFFDNIKTGRDIGTFAGGRSYWYHSIVEVNGRTLHKYRLEALTNTGVITLERRFGFEGREDDNPKLVYSREVQPLGLTFKSDNDVE
ncbi:MAG: hypothetical protein AAGM38_04095 [Pseudomonadota bacterium]